MPEASSSEVKGKTKATKQKAKPAPYIPSGLEMVMMRNNFYRNNYRRMLKVSIFLTFIAAGLAGFIFYQYYTRTIPVYFATTEDGKLFNVEPLSSRFLNDQQLSEWAMQAAIASYTYDFVNYRQELQNAKLYYTPEGHRLLLKAIQDSRNLEAVKSKKLTTSARVTGAPEILGSGLDSQGRYSWRIRFPMRVRYENNRPRDLITQNIIIEMTISRVPVWDSSMGIGIKRIIVRENIPQRPQANAASAQRPGAGGTSKGAKR